MTFSIRTNMKTLRKERGFTLTELVVTIGIFSILAGIAIPAFSNWLPDYRLRCATRDLYSSFQLAKVTAIKSGANCTITFNQPVDGTTYDYVVFRDTDNDLEYDTAENTGIIRKVKWADYKGVSENGNTFSANDDDLPAVAFMSNGIPTNNAGGFGAGTLSLKNTNNKETGVVLSVAGNIRIN